MWMERGREKAKMQYGEEKWKSGKGEEGVMRAKVASFIRIS